MSAATTKIPITHASVVEAPAAPEMVSEVGRMYGKAAAKYHQMTAAPAPTAAARRP